MSSPATICTDLTDRINRYRARYRGEIPKELPVTLDEWAWVTEAIYGEDTTRCWVALEFFGVKLRLVESISHTKDGAVVVRP